MSKRCKRTSKRTSEWPSTAVWILDRSGPQCINEAHRSLIDFKEGSSPFNNRHYEEMFLLWVSEVSCLYESEELLLAAPNWWDKWDDDKNQTLSSSISVNVFSILASHRTMVQNSLLPFAHSIAQKKQISFAPRLRSIACSLTPKFVKK